MGSLIYKFLAYGFISLQERLPRCNYTFGLTPLLLIP